MPERLRGWTRNPLGSARRGSNPLGVVVAVTDRVTWRQREPVGRPWLHEHRHKMCTSAQHADDTVPERLRGWTRNPLGSARRGSNPLGVALCRPRCNPFSCPHRGAHRNQHLGPIPLGPRQWQIMSSGVEWERAGTLSIPQKSVATLQRLGT